MAWKSLGRMTTFGNAQPAVDIFPQAIQSILDPHLSLHNDQQATSHVF